MVGRIILALTSFLLGALAEASASGATLLTGSETVNVGDVFTIPISIASAQDLTSFQFDLAFDPTVIKALSLTDIGTDFAKAAIIDGGFLTGIAGFVDNTTGVLSGVADSMSGLTTGAGLTPNGVVVDATFQALAIGVAPLTLSNAFLTDNGVPLSSANGNFELVNGQVNVQVSVPEPTTLILLSFALAGCGILRCRRRGGGRNVVGAACAPVRRRQHRQTGEDPQCASYAR
jgi:hypothetical protein